MVKPTQVYGSNCARNVEKVFTILWLYYSTYGAVQYGCTKYSYGCTTATKSWFGPA